MKLENNMTDKKYPKTQTAENEKGLHMRRSNMLQSFKIFGEFWEIDLDGEATSEPVNGILEWNPDGDSTLYTPDISEDGFRRIGDFHQSPSAPVCIQGRWLKNIDGAKFTTCHLTLDAWLSGRQFTASNAASYQFASKTYSVNGIWIGRKPLNLYTTKYSQLTFWFQGLEKWIWHLPQIKLEHSEINHLDTWEWDILRDFHVPNVGKVKLLCGHELKGDLLFNQSLSVSHLWQVDFRKQKTYMECLDVVQAVWNFLSIAIGSTIPLGGVTLVESNESNKFNLWIRYHKSTQDPKPSQDILSKRREYIPFRFLSDTSLRKWIKLETEQKDKSFGDLISLLTSNYSFSDMPAQYKVLMPILVIEKITKNGKWCNPGASLNKRIEETIKTLISNGFPEILADITIGGKSISKWVAENRNTKIAHLGRPDAVKSYHIGESFYAERILQLIAISLTLLEYEIFSPKRIKQYFWEGYRTEEELAWTPDKISSTSIFEETNEGTN